MKLAILEAAVKGYHECSLAVRVGDRFIVNKERGERGPALRVIDNDRGQLGHLQRELVPENQSRRLSSIGFGNRT